MTSAKLKRLALWFLVPALPLSAAEPALVLENTIPLHGVGGRIDHMALDRDRKRLIIAELGNSSVEVIDVAAGTILHRNRWAARATGGWLCGTGRCHPDRQRGGWIGAAVLCKELH